MSTGVRREELLGLKWKNIDFDNSKITIENTVTYVSGYGIIENEFQTKTFSSNRTLSISSELLKVLKEYKNWCIEKYKVDNLNIQELHLFIKNDLTVIFPETINKWLNKCLKECQLEHCNVHSLRHAYASLLLGQHSLVDVSKRIGHARVSTTTDIYGHSIFNDDQHMANTSSYLSNIPKKNKDSLDALNVLLQNGIITKEEFESKKTRFLN